MLPARKTVSKKTLLEEHSSNFWIKIPASRLSYELGLFGEKNSIENLKYYEKWT